MKRNGLNKKKQLQSLKKIESHEWQLWSLAFILIVALGSLIVLTYFYLLDDSIQEFGLTKSTADTALMGLSGLIIVFCLYVVQTRFTLSQMQVIIQEQATHDNLTHLYNRHFFNIRIKEEITRADRDGRQLAVLLCDFDGFKRINDLKGNHVGDEILIAAAENIRESIRGTDLIFRWGGDEIVVVLWNTQREGCLVAGQRIRKNIQKLGEKNDLPLELSVGIALYPQHGKDADSLMGLADRALFIAKRGGGKVHIGEEEYRLNEQTIKIVFQPIVNVGSNQILGYEALGRDPQGKLEILEIFKKYQSVGQLNDLKCICFRSTLKVAEQIGLNRVFINVDFNLLKSLKSFKKPEGIDVILEISELEALDEITNRLDIADRWKNEGYRFAIDDFGAGFISLPFIARLIPEYIKLDRSTVLHAVQMGHFRGFLKKMVPALQMNATEGIIAEGIETQEELKVVKDLGIHFIQGFLMGRPQELTQETRVALDSRR